MTFRSDTGFDDASFSGAALFDRASFSANISFVGVTFTDNASFVGVTFTDNFSFGGVTFTGNASFDGATFTGSDTSFVGATFTDNVGFDGVTFAGTVSFAGATFTRNALFKDATFARNALFNEATFTGDAWFEGTTFTGSALFAGATFGGTAWFSDAIAHAYDYRSVQFHTTDPGPWIGERVTLAGAVLHLRARVVVAAVEGDYRRLQSREGVHLVCLGDAVDLEDAEFLRRSILAHSASQPSIPERHHPGERPEGFDDLSPAEQGRWTAQEEAFQLAQSLVGELGPQQVKRTRLVSLRRATAGDLVLSGVGLEDCAFAGAHGLDKLRIDATCSFQRPPTWPWRTWRPFTGRRIIYEETQWRRAHTAG